MALLDPPKCSNASDTTPSDAGVAGAGILLSFMITAGLAIILSTSVIVGDFRNKKHSTIRRKLLNGYSDSQILQGIGIQCVGLAGMNTLVPYHFFLIWMMSLLSMATHNAALLALVHDYRRDWVLRWLRQTLIALQLVLSCVFGVYILQAITKGVEDETLPIACVWQVKGAGAPPTAGLSFVGTIAVIAGNCVIFALATWYLHSRNQRFYKVVQIVGMILMTAIAVGAAIRIILLSQAFGTPSVELSDNKETEWSFGQVLSMMVLFFPLVSVIEIARGEITVMPPVEDDRERLYDGELQSNPHVGNSLQPNPFFGSQTNLFKK